MENCEIHSMVLYVILLINVLFIIILLKERDELKKNVVIPIDNIDIENTQKE